MFKKLRNKIEEKRNSKKVFWKLAVLLKDASWYIYYKAPREIVSILKLLSYNILTKIRINYELIFKRIYKNKICGFNRDFFSGIYSKKKILVIVAHPDDETIWAGGTLLKTKSNKTIISLCRKNDRDRAHKFKKACKILNAKGYISDLDDLENGNYKKIFTQDIINRVLKIIKNNKYDYIFTHGKNGEYGNIRHIEVHYAVNEMLRKKLLSAKKVFFFSYIRKGKFCYINLNADNLIKLQPPYFKIKKQLIQDIYDFEKNSFENKCCRNVESFDIKK